MFHCYDKTSFLGLVERGNEKEVTALLQQGDVPRDELDRALQLAMLGSHRRIAQRLLERGADPFHGDREDRQALAYAAMGGDPELVSLCLSLGAEPNRVDQRNATALALAASWGKTEAVQILCAAGADPEIAPSYGGTALIEASRTGNHPDTMAALLDAGANVHAVEPGQERTALYYAADRGHDGKPDEQRAKDLRLRVPGVPQGDRGRVTRARRRQGADENRAAPQVQLFPQRRGARRVDARPGPGGDLRLLPRVPARREQTGPDRLGIGRHGASRGGRGGDKEEPDGGFHAPHSLRLVRRGA